MDKKIKLAENFDPKRLRTQATGQVIAAGAIASVFIVGTFVLGLLSFPYLSAWADALPAVGNEQQVNWGMLEGLASLVTLSIIVGGVVFAFTDYLQNAVQRKREDAEASFNIYKEIYDRLMSPESVAARRWIILNLPTLEDAGNDKQVWLERINREVNKTPRGWKGERPPGKEYIKDILNTFDFIGFVAKHYWNIENELVLWMSAPIAKVWERLDYYVEEEARQRNEPDYYEAARELGRYCLAWRQEQYPKSNIVKDAT